MVSELPVDCPVGESRLAWSINLAHTIKDTPSRLFSVLTKAAEASAVSWFALRLDRDRPAARIEGLRKRVFCNGALLCVSSRMI